MIGILGVSALSLSMLQASITGPTSTFRTCLHEAADKAAGEKVGGDKIEDYLKTTCSAQMNALTSAIISFRTKNGMSKKAAAADAEMTVEDYVATPADNYRFMINYNAPAVQPAAAPAAAPATPPPQPSSQPHKP
jgi:hypothetical protein